MSTSSDRSCAAAGPEGASGMSALRPRPSAGRLSAMVLLLGWIRQRLRGRLARHQLARERDVGFRPPRLGIVENDGEAMARRLAEPDVAWNDGFEHALLE